MFSEKIFSINTAKKYWRKNVSLSQKYQNIASKNCSCDTILTWILQNKENEIETHASHVLYNMYTGCLHLSELQE